MVMWDEIAEEVSAEFPDVTWDKMLVDAMTVRMTLQPESLDTIVATNLHADILSDLAGARPAASGLRQPPILIPKAGSRRCLNQSMGQPLTLPAKVSPTRWRLFGAQHKCWTIWALIMRRAA